MDEASHGGRRPIMPALRPSGCQCAALFHAQDRAAYPVSQTHLIRPAWGSHPPATAADDPGLHLLGNFIRRPTSACEATPARQPRTEGSARRPPRRPGSSPRDRPQDITLFCTRKRPPPHITSSLPAKRMRPQLQQARRDPVADWIVGLGSIGFVVPVAIGT